MADILTDLKGRFKQGNIVIQLIYINVGVFIAVKLISLFFLLFNASADDVWKFFELPASFTRFITSPWTLITYMFMHADVWHILFNMLWLYWFGLLFLQFFSSKHLRGLYFFGGFMGGLLFILSYNVFPFFAPVVSYAVMVGASASILSIVTAVAYREPNYPIRLLFLGVIRLKYVALATVLLDVVFLASGDNSGGHIAHLGGALAGLCFAAALEKGRDLTAGINYVIDAILRLFDRKTWRRKPKMRVYRTHTTTSDREKDYDYNARRKANEAEIDRILDKLKQSGYQSLTTAEKKTLFDAGKK